MLNEGLSLLSAGGGLFLAVIVLYISLQASGITQPFQKLFLGVSLIILSLFADGHSATIPATLSRRKGRINSP